MSKEEALELFKPGDFLTRDNDCIFIFAGLEERGPQAHAIVYHALKSKSTTYSVARTSMGIGCVEEATLKHATNKDKIELLKAIKKHGFIWNEEGRKLEPILTEEETALPF